jgi:hypothetical protein
MTRRAGHKSIQLNRIGSDGDTSICNFKRLRASIE